jgi:hypothetical protein
MEKDQRNGGKERKDGGEGPKGPERPERTGKKIQNPAALPNERSEDGKILPLLSNF